MPSWACSLRASALGDEGLRIAEAVDHLGEPHDCLVGDWCADPPPRRPPQGAPPARTGRGHSVRTWTSRAGSPGRLQPWVRHILSRARADAVPLLTQAMEQSDCWEEPIFRRSVVSPWGRRICWPAAWRRRTPSPSARWRSPVSTRNVATRRMPYVSSARLPRSAIPQRSRWPKPTTGRPSP